MPLQHAHHSPMPRPNHELQHLHQVNAAQSPAAAQHPVVVVLDAYPRVSLEDIQLLQQLLNVEELNVPRTFLRLNGHLQGRGCRAVPAAGVEKAKLDSCMRAESRIRNAEVCYGTVKRRLLCRK